ncbi:MAG: type II toxin-antitoxin system RelB/DinJ family antitoxin [Firmicutes bacterium]|nr:type II toxin-antitoxin system RelB/DinJ family antitoxin [Bacillota bacterium]
MAVKTANLYARIEPDVKEQAENILSSLGIPVSSAINMFYKQIIMQKGIPFELKIPTPPNDLSKMSKVEFEKKMEEAYNDYLKGQVTTVDEVFAKIRKDYNI